MKTAISITIILAVSAIGADAPIPDAESVAKTYAKTFTRLTEKPKSISAQLASMCRSIPDDEKFGPHSRNYVHHFRNELAKTAKGDFPAGSALVKEKFMAGEKGQALVPDGATGMIKLAKGTSAKTGDWLFFSVSEGKVHTIAKAESCAGCHSGAKRDFVFTDAPKL